MVGTRPINKLRKIPHDTSIDLTIEPSPATTKVHRSIKMEKEPATTTEIYAKIEEPTTQDASLLENITGDHLSLGNSKGEEESEREEEEEQFPAATQENPSSTTSKRKEGGLHTLYRQTPATSSHTQTPTAETEEKKNYGDGSSSEQAGSEKEPSMEVVKEEPPAKRTQIQTRASKRKKKMVVKTKGKEPQRPREVVVPKAIDWEILE